MGRGNPCGRGQVALANGRGRQILWSWGRFQARIAVTTPCSTAKDYIIHCSFFSLGNIPGTAVPDACGIVFFCYEYFSPSFSDRTYSDAWLDR